MLRAGFVGCVWCNESIGCLETVDSSIVCDDPGGGRARRLWGRGISRCNTVSSGRAAKASIHGPRRSNCRGVRLFTRRRGLLLWCRLVERTFPSGLIGVFVPVVWVTIGVEDLDPSWRQAARHPVVMVSCLLCGCPRLISAHRTKTSALLPGPSAHAPSQNAQKTARCDRRGRLVRAPPSQGASFSALGRRYDHSAE